MPPEPSQPYTVLDVFTDAPLTGNPLAVFTEGETIPSRLMQATARELNLSETIFLLPGDDDADATVRIFTPAAELPFAGHPILGAAFVIAQRDQLASVRLQTQAGIVLVTLSREHEEIVRGEMEQPLPTVEPFEHTAELLAGLGLSESTLPVERYCNGPVHVMVGVADRAELAALDPDLGALARLGEFTISCFAPFEPSPASGEHRQVESRVFCPGLGVTEDPATGSAAGPLALHLVRHGRLSSGRTLEITQGLRIGRPSRLDALVEGSGEHPTRVCVSGSAVVVAHGSFRLQ